MSTGAEVDAGVRTPRFVALIPLVLAMLSMIGPFSIDTPFPAFPGSAISSPSTPSSFSSW